MAVLPPNRATTRQTFGGVYPTTAQQQQRAQTAVSTAIHGAGMKNMSPTVPYQPKGIGSGTLVPTGSPYGKQWGELTRQNKSGKDIWGGTETPGLKFGGGTPQRSDYWHQMAEQRTTTPAAYTTPTSNKTYRGSWGWGVQTNPGGIRPSGVSGGPEGARSYE